MSNLQNIISKSMGHALVAWVFATAVLAFVATPAVAAIIEVNSLADNEVAGNGLCTLREAMLNANNDDELSSGDCLGGAGNDAIVFSTGPGTILIGSQLPQVKTEMAIIGPTAGNMIVEGSPSFGASHFWVSWSGVLVLDRIDIRVSSGPCVWMTTTATSRFYRSNLSCADGISMSYGTLTLDSSSIGGVRAIDIIAGYGTASITVVNSTIGGSNWAIGADAFNDAEIIIDVQNSTLTGRTGGWGMYIDALDESTVFVDVVDSIVEDLGSGLILTSRGSGGDSRVSAVVERTVFRNNFSKALAIQGTSSPAFVSLNDSTIEGSSVGIRNTNTLGHLFITNSTISGNGHGVDNGDDISTGGSIEVTLSTITNNGRGIFTEGSAYTAISRTILADNDIDCAGEAPNSTGYNVVGVNCGISASTVDIIGTVGSPVDPKLFALADNGGPTRTHQLSTDSPAVDLVVPAACFTASDQRGSPRPVGNGCDAGSYELEDSTPPEITVPGPITQEATSPGGTVVTYVVTATDDLDPDPGLFCSPSSGSLFPLGTTTVYCTATDLLGNVAHADFHVTVQDTTPPQITVPGLITKEATGPGGAIATYVVTVSDIVDPDPNLFCLPTSGSLFPIGTTTVFCTATDSLGNVAQSIFDVTIQDTTPPSLILIGAAEIEVIEGNSYHDPGANAFDIVDGDLTTEITATNPVNTSIPGVYTVSYNVTDDAGNAADTVTRTVTVISQVEAAEDLVETVESLGLPNSVSISLIQLMTNVAHHLDDENEANDAAARVLLDQFIAQVQNHLNHGRLTEAEAALLIAKAEELQSALEG